MSSGKTAQYTVLSAKRAAEEAARRQAEAEEEAAKHREWILAQERLAREREQWILAQERLAREEEERARVQAQARLVEVSNAFEKLQHNVREASSLYGNSINVALVAPSPATESSSSEIQAVTEKLQASVREAADKLRAQIAGVRAASIVRPSLQSAVRDGVAIHQQVDEELRSLDAEADPTTREAVENLAQAILNDSNEARARISLKALRYKIGAANRAAHVSRVRIEKIVAQRLRLAGLGTSEAERMISFLDKLSSGASPIPGDLDKKVEAVVARAADEANRQYVVKVLTNCMDKIGIEAGSDFETAIGLGKPGYARPTNRPGYAVEVQFNAAAESINFEVVATAQYRKASEDRTVQEEFCDSYEKLVASARDHGVKLAATQITPPGVQVRAIEEPDDAEYSPPKMRERRL